MEYKIKKIIIKKKKRKKEKSSDCINTKENSLEGKMVKQSTERVRLDLKLQLRGMHTVAWEALSSF